LLTAHTFGKTILFNKERRTAQSAKTNPRLLAKPKAPHLLKTPKNFTRKQRIPKPEPKGKNKRAKTPSKAYSRRKPKVKNRAPPINQGRMPLKPKMTRKIFPVRWKFKTTRKV